MSRSLGECGLVSESPQDVRLVLERPNTKRGRASRGQWPSHWVATSVTCKMKITTLIKPQTCTKATLWSPVLPYMVIYMYLYFYLLCQQQQQEWSFLSLHLVFCHLQSFPVQGWLEASLVSRPHPLIRLLPDFSCSYWVNPSFLHSCEIKSGSGMGMRLIQSCNLGCYKKLEHS